MADALFDRIGVGYSSHRRPDPRILRHIEAALGACRSVLNVGAGTGSYEPVDRFVVAVEPSVEMTSQRPEHAATAVRATAERLPVRDRAFDAGLAILTLHHWADRGKGLCEMRRVSRERVVILTWDPGHDGFWLVRDYFPEILETDRSIFPGLDEIEGLLGPIEVRDVPIPADCTDGFLGAYWRRPSRYLDPEVRRPISTFAKMDDPAPGLERLGRDLADGTWHRRNGDLLALSEIDLGYRLVIART